MTTQSTARRSSRSYRRGFTLPEYAVTLVLIVVVCGAMLSAFIFGGRIVALAEVKLDNAEDLRFTASLFTHDVRTAAEVEIGQGSSNQFTKVGPNMKRQGNAIQIYPTGATNIYVRYFVDTNDQTLKAFSTDDGQTVSLVDSVTNRIVFTVEDFSKNPAIINIATNDAQSQTVGMLLQVFEPVMRGSTNKTLASMNQYYQLSTKVKMRNHFGYQ